mgnify:CR=1 FL=1
MPLALLGVVDVTDFKIGFSGPTPSTSATLIVGLREIARFDTSWISIV